MEGHERARIQVLDTDHRQMNRMLWRQHPVFALRFAMVSRLTVDRFWLPIANSMGRGMGYGSGLLHGGSGTDDRP